MQEISVRVCAPGEDIAGQWASLCRCAAVNVFMHPVALRAAHEAGIAHIHLLLAWHRGAQPERLVGVWALREARLTPLWPSFLAAPPYSYAWLSNPVVDPQFMDEVVAAFFDAIAQDVRLPKVLRLRYLDGDCASYDAIVKASGARGAHSLKLLQRERAFITRDSGYKRSGSTRKKLRQDWNRLGAAGRVEVANERSANAVRDAFETFLSLEAASWKGASGTALLCTPRGAGFARRLVAALAAEGNASVALLRLDGRPIAAQVLFYCGATAYTWGTAFDAAYGKFSPGALLVDRITESLFASDTVQAIESCSPQGGFMRQMWEGRRSTVDLLVDVGRRKSLGFAAVSMSERSESLRVAVAALRARARALKPR